MGEYKEIYDEFDELPEDMRSKIYEATTGRMFDVATPLRKGKAWTFEGMRTHQPKTWEALEGGSELFAVRRRHGDTYLQALVLSVGGEVIEVCRDFWGRNPSDPGYQEWLDRVSANLTRRWGRPMKKEERHLSLPRSIRLAYYHRFNGLNVPRRVPWGVERRMLPRPTSSWDSIDGYLESVGRKKQWLPLVEEMIPGIRPAQRDVPYTNFMLFLDSRPTVAGSEGDVLFVKNHIQDGIVYYIRDANVQEMMIINDPESAIDAYCAHVLLTGGERFDFMKYASKL